uniref:Uncharacterized protein n=1 Tax=Rhizophora mucronata TaxID=61149 RepID=A0A2P2Q0W2_RHIMU
MKRHKIFNTDMKRYKIFKDLKHQCT